MDVIWDYILESQIRWVEKESKEGKREEAAEENTIQTAGRNQIGFQISPAKFHGFRHATELP